jgi:hypothetical protein
MRWILGIVLLLLAAGSMSCQLKVLSAELVEPARNAAWVRTVDGWERPHNWSPSHAGPPTLHPLVLAAGQVLLSAFALVAATSSDKMPQA